MEVLVSVCAETPAVGHTFECGNAFVTVVLVDPRGAPLPVPCTLALPTDATHPDARRAVGAAARRDERLAMRAAVTEKEARRPSLDGTMLRGVSAADLEAVARAMERRFVDA